MSGERVALVYAGFCLGMAFFARFPPLQLVGLTIGVGFIWMVLAGKPRP